MAKRKSRPAHRSHSHADHHRSRLTRKQKMILHFSLIVLIAISLFTEGGKLADWAFVALAGVVEVS